MFDALARALIIGLTLSHGRRHVYRALLEGAAIAPEFSGLQSSYVYHEDNSNSANCGLSPPDFFTEKRPRHLRETGFDLSTVPWYSMV